ncbi:ZDHHC-type palmitoyltransferase 6 [Biomphalaria glabrata]|nr:ZDHHC-type palmitoyltransferase 6 [Biomphalaria glabrata]
MSYQNAVTIAGAQATAFEMLMDAVGRNQSPVIQQLLSSDPHLVHLKGWHGITALHKACLIGDYNSVLMLIQANSDVNAATDHLETPLHYACKRGTPSIVHLLVQCGARLDLKDKLGRSALHHAAEAGSVQVVKYLEEVCEVNTGEQDLKLQSPLHIACTYGHYDLFHFLLKNRRCELLQEDIEGNLPIHLACKHGFGHMTWTLLCLSGVSVLSRVNKGGYTPVDLVLQGDSYGHKELAGILTDYREHPNKPVSGPVLLWYGWLMFPFTLYSVTTILCQQMESYQFLIYLAAFLIAGIAMNGMTHRIKHICRWPNPFYAGVFAAGITHTTFCYFWIIFPYIYTTWWVTLFSFIICPLLHLLFWTLLVKDPGSVTVSTHDISTGKTLTLLDLCMIRNPPYNYCPSCDLVTNEVTKHCKLCDKCFLHLDHHCLFLLKCVAIRNHVHFVWLLILSVLNMLAYLLGFFLYSHTRFDRQSWSDIASQTLHQQAWPLSLVLLNSWSAVWCSFLLHTQYTQVTKGCTTYFMHSVTQPLSLTRLQALTNFVHFLFNSPLPYKNPHSKLYSSHSTEVTI